MSNTNQAKDGLGSDDSLGISNSDEVSSDSPTLTHQLGSNPPSDSESLPSEIDDQVSGGQPKQMLGKRKASKRVLPKGSKLKKTRDAADKDEKRK